MWSTDALKWSIDALKSSTDALQWSTDALHWSTGWSLSETVAHSDFEMPQRYRYHLSINNIRFPKGPTLECCLVNKGAK